MSIVGCAPQDDGVPENTSIRFEEVAEFQTGNLTTDLIAVPEGVGLAAVDHGWQRVDDAESGDSWLAVAGKLGRLTVFSADGDLEELELELKFGDDSRRRKLPVHVLLNGNRIDRIHPTETWSSISVKVPQEEVRRGMNILELTPRSASRLEAEDGGPQLQLRRLRLRSESGRTAWPARPQALEIDDSIAMPATSFVDLVLAVPQGARIAGRYTFELASSENRPVWAYIQLLDEQGRQRTLLNKRFLKSARRAREVEVDLSGWAGNLVRLRVGTTGPGNGVVRWSDLRVTGNSPVERPDSLPPIRRTDGPRSGRLGQPDVFVILLDAARADAFSPFGGPYPTPATERLAGDGTVFERALAPASWTGQSVPSMLTGLYPDSLRVGALGSRMPDEIPTLPELMSAKGYRTVLWSQHPLYQNHKSFRRGFEEVHRSTPGVYDDLPDGTVLLADDRPSFAWIHLIPPHTPYQPPKPFRGLYTSGYSGTVSAEDQYLSRFPHNEDPASLAEADLQYLWNRYLENVSFADSLVARLLAELEHRGRYRSSLIVLLSDHGEAFLEHGAFLHTRSLHTELLHVPLIVKWPADQTGFADRDSTPVSLVDLVPTLVDGLDLAGAEAGYQGTSLLPGAFDGVTAKRTLYAVTRGVEDRRKAPKPAIMLQSGPWRLLHNHLGASDLFFNHEEDPGETRDLSTAEPLQALLLRQALLSQAHSNRYLLGTPTDAAEVEELDPEVVEQLKALGYLN